MSSSSSSSLLQLPCLAVEHRWKGTGNCSTTSMFTVAGKKNEDQPITVRTDSNEFFNKAFCPTPQGWILVRDRQDVTDTYLLDPHTHDQKNKSYKTRSIALPPLLVDQDDLIHCTCLLSDKPNSPSCVLLVVEPYEPVIWYVNVTKDRCWTRHEYDLGIQGDETSGFHKILMNSAAACRGKFYFMTSPKKFGVLEFSPGPVFGSFAMDDGGEGSYDPKESAKVFLVESEEELYMVRQLHGLEYNEAVVHKMDYHRRQWRIARDLGGRAFFVAPFSFGASCLAGDLYRPDCVYSLVKPSDKRFYSPVKPSDERFRIFDVTDGTMQWRKIEEAYVYVFRNEHGMDPRQIMHLLVSTMVWMIPIDPKAA